MRTVTKHNLALLYIINILCVMGLVGCKKDWLDAKPSKSLIVPSSIEDYQKLLDNNDNYNFLSTGLGEISSDNYYAPFTLWQGRPTLVRNTYMWADDPFLSASITAWNRPYTNIFQDNLVLEGTEKLAKENSGSPDYKNLKGTALFFRGYDQYNLAQLFCQPYDNKNSSTDLGIPIKLTANVNEKAIRSTVKQTYEQILSDLKASILLLPITPLYRTRPSKPAVYAMLSRVYLAMREYERSYAYADSCLMLYSKLIDYNNINSSVGRPFTRFNEEVILDWDIDTDAILSNGVVDSTLYRSYHENDLRKLLYFNSATLAFRGSYNGTLIASNALAVDEIYLNRSECAARLGKYEQAKADLNTLLIKRFKKGTYIPLTSSDPKAILKVIIEERRKELLYRGLRWTDLRRLNKDEATAVTLRRNLSGQIYTLPPNDLRYVLPIPANEILASGIPQNPR